MYTKCTVIFYVRNIYKVCSFKCTPIYNLDVTGDISYNEITKPFLFSLLCFHTKIHMLGVFNKKQYPLSISLKVKYSSSSYIFLEQVRNANTDFEIEIRVSEENACQCQLEKFLSDLFLVSEFPLHKKRNLFDFIHLFEKIIYFTTESAQLIFLFSVTVDEFLFHQMY